MIATANLSKPTSLDSDSSLIDHATARMAYSSHQAQDVIIPQLLNEGIITYEALKHAEALAQQDGTESVLYHLIRTGSVRPEVVNELLANHFNCEPVNLLDLEIDEKIAHLIEAKIAVAFRVMPIAKEGRRLKVAMADPRNTDAIDQIMFATSMDVIPVVADTYTLATRIEQVYNRTGEEAQEALTLLDFQGADSVQEVENWLEDVQEEIEEAPIVRLIHATLHEAVKKRASDIHVEPLNAQVLRIRFRIDGELREIARTSIRLRDAIITRIKVMADLDIAEKRKPQDGRIRRKIGNRAIDFRVSIIPTSFGEKAVLRILDKSAVTLDLESLGIDERGLNILLNTLNSPYGMIIATGPTGAGKTTTLYSMLLRLNSTAKNIVSAEDPIEYDLEGITQTQVRAEHGLDFADILRAFLRQDPDVIMVGEMRDQATVQIAIRAALTGHMVLTTLHTNDAPSAFARLLDMGAERWNVANAVSVIIAQRLVRSICDRCKRTLTRDELSPYLKSGAFTEAELMSGPFFKGSGCQACDLTGYRGRTGIFEVLPVTTEIRKLIMDPTATTDQIRVAARNEGMQTLREAGLERARAGITTLDEVIRETRTQS